MFDEVLKQLQGGQFTVDEVVQLVEQLRFGLLTSDNVTAFDETVYARHFLLSGIKLIESGCNMLQIANLHCEQESNR